MDAHASATRRATTLGKQVLGSSKAPDLRYEINLAVRSSGLRVLGHVTDEFAEILTPAALHFVAGLAKDFEQRRRQLLAEREKRQRAISAGEMPNFNPATAHIRQRAWKVAPPPHDLLDRRVEITGPVDRKMVINGLNSGANCFMADFEDANSPTWSNCIEGQINLRDAGTYD